LILENKGIILKISHLYCPDRHAREDLARRSFTSCGGLEKATIRSTVFSPGCTGALNVAISFYREGRRRVDACHSRVHLEIEDEDTELSREKERSAGCKAVCKG